MADGRGASVQLVEAHREMWPELHEKVEAVAQLVDPTAWPGEAWDGTGPEAKRIDWEDNASVQFRRSVARSKAWDILKHLGIYDPKVHGFGNPALLARAWGWKAAAPSPASLQPVEAQRAPGEPEQLEREGERPAWHAQAIDAVENYAALIAYNAGLGAGEWESCVDVAIRRINQIGRRPVQHSGQEPT